MSRIRAGWFSARNPFTPKQLRAYSLKPEDVDAIVFWTKNPVPLFPALETLDDCGYNYYFQYTLNDYPKCFEPGLPPLEDRIRAFQQLGSMLGGTRVVWRYDPVILSTLTPAGYHVDKVSYLASRLAGYTSRLTISFLDCYAKVQKRLEKIARANEFEFQDITKTQGDLAFLCNELVSIASLNGMELASCAERLPLEKFGVARGSCIDGALIQDLFGIAKPLRKDKGQRPECLCVTSVDMGVYNTCRHQCVYCYANFSEKTIFANLRKHDASSPYLIGTHDGPPPGTDGRRRASSQLRLH